MATTDSTAAAGNTNQGSDTSTQPAGGATAAPEAGTQQPAAGGQTDGAQPGAKADGGDGKTQTDGKPAGDASAKTDDTDQGDGKAKATGAPEKYEDFKMPEGAQMDAEGLTSFSEFARSMDMTQDAAQAMLNKMAPAMQARQQAVAERTKAGWLDSLKADKDLGGDKFDESLQFADRGLKAVGSEALNKLLTDTGLNKHPEIVRAFVRVGKEVSEDGKFVGGASKTGAELTTAQRMYPNMNP